MAGKLEVRIPNNWIPRPYQMNAWGYLENGGRHAELIWHRRSGKDEVSLHWTAVSCFKRPGNYWHMLPQANQARKAIWMAVNPHTSKRRIDEAFPPPVRTSVNDHEMSISLIGGSVWQVVGSDNFNSLLGSPPAGLVFSEWALCDPASWAYLMPIIEENKGWAIFNSTPRGKNHAYRSLNSARKTQGQFAEVLTAASTGIFSKEQLEAIKIALIGTYGDEFGLSIFEQEYLCSFEAANLGAILGRGLVRAETEDRISDDHGYDFSGAPVEISSDIGRRDASSWWFWQPCVGGFRLVDFDRDSGMDADEWCERLATLVKDRGYTLGRIWLPHDAKAKTFSAKHSAIEIFINYFGSQIMRITPNSEREDRINAARRVLRHCKFHRTRTEKGREGLSAWSYVYDEERKEFSKEPDHNWASHDGDSFSYGAIVMEEDFVKEEKPKQSSLFVGEDDTNLFQGVTLNDLWKSAPQISRRI